MKKSVLSIVAIAFAAVSVLSSCDKNDDGYGQSAKTTTVQTNSNSSASSNSSTGSSTNSSTVSALTFKGKCFFINDELASLGTFKIQVSDGTKTSEYDLAAQGQHGTKTFNSEDKDQTVTSTGYYLEVVLPANGDLTFKVTFVPNDKAKSLTAKDNVNAIWTTAIGKGKTSSINFHSNIHVNEGVRGDKMISFCERLASCMSD